MSRRIEGILIASAIFGALLYAIVSFWPAENPQPQAQSSAAAAPIESPTMTQATSRHAEAEAISNLIKIGSAQLSFRGLKKRFGTLEELTHENLLGRNFSEGAIIDGYQYGLGADAEHFAVRADPVPGPGRHYFIDETLDLRYDENGRASSSSPYLSYSKNELPPPDKDSPLDTGKPQQ